MRSAISIDQNFGVALSNGRQSDYRLGMITHPPGTHILLDFFGCKYLSDPEALRKCLEAAAAQSGATVLRGDFHKFGPEAGVTGVLMLAESHISIHTWPEADFAAIDIFMCGSASADKAAEVLLDLLAPARVETTRVARGQRNQ